MTLQERIETLVQLGEHLLSEDEYLDALMQRTHFNNHWFIIENQQKAVRAIATHFLQRDKLEEWLSHYDIPEREPSLTVGLVMAGNIPIVGFHDLLCVFVAGHKATIKLSEKDRFLLPYLLKLLERFHAKTATYFELTERLQNFDAVIATGSNNSARYFDAYFGKYPNIIRRNRNGVAVLTGTETTDELHTLGKDVFSYFGLGCRNVSKLYLPEGYDFNPLLEALHDYRDIVLHSKYKNNFDYHYAIHVLNKEPFWNNGCIILTENKSLQSPVANLFFEYYENEAALENELKSREEEIQVIVSKKNWIGLKSVPFGQAQEPELWDYADGVDTLAFLLSL